MVVVEAGEDNSNRGIMSSISLYDWESGPDWPFILTDKVSSVRRQSALFSWMLSAHGATSLACCRCWCRCWCGRTTERRPDRCSCRVWPSGVIKNYVL